MTKEVFFEYLSEISRNDGDDVICVEHIENGWSHFGIYNPNESYGGPYKYYVINEAGDCVSLCESTNEEWKIWRWPNASYEDYQEYIAKKTQG